ncbi:fibronectin type III domain-containing protein [Candidatus Poribacteria bacterium]|nr:fibronectin type III domain-containing protein [Candidatus Poribacteria bacterium]
MLDASRPCHLRLTRNLSLRTIFVGVLLILMSLLIAEAVAQDNAPGAPTGLKATAGDKRIKLSWTPPSNKGTDTLLRYYTVHDVVGIVLGKSNNQTSRDKTTTSATITFTQQVTRQFSVYPDYRAADGTFPTGALATPITVTTAIPAPTAFTATLDDPSIGDRTVTLNWTAPSPTRAAINGYQYSQNGGTWTSAGSSTSYSVSGLTNGISYTFRVRATRTNEDPEKFSQKSRTVRVTPLIDAPGSPGTLSVKRVGKTAILTWSPLRSTGGFITRYEYSDDGGATWKSTRSTRTTYTVTGLKTGQTYTFLVRAVYVDGTTSRIISHPSNTSNSAVLTVPKRRVIQDCPVGWVRSDGFAGRTRRVLLYEVKLDMDFQNRTSIYKPDWVAIYVHPDEKLENLEGWKLQVAVPYNRHRDYLLTAENSVVVEAGFVEGGFAFIANPEENPFPMTGIGFAGSPAPGFDYRLYDHTGRRVDFGISCYKRFDIFQVLKDLEDPRVLRNVSLKDVDWNASRFIRSEWTLPIPVNAPGAPSAPGVNLVGKWADLKKK